MEAIEAKEFSPLEESISFYTRNDFAIINHILTSNYADMCKFAIIAYRDNEAILEEYNSGVRTIDSVYDEKWINSLGKRIIGELGEAEKQIVIRNAENDISNILSAMGPATNIMHLYRTAWIDKSVCSVEKYPYSREYKALDFEIGNVYDIKIISSYSMSPYREDEDVGSDYYRYEIDIVKGDYILELNQFITHNEDGEVLLPPMKCKVIDIHPVSDGRCKGIIKLQYIKPLNLKN